MRIVFELEGNQPQVFVTVDAYHCGRVDQPPQWRGGRVELLITDCINWGDNDKRREGDSIHIDGDTNNVRRALTQALELLDINERHARQQVEAQIARTVVCPLCKTYADPKNEWHGDGHGKACYGLAQERLRIVGLEVAAAIPHDPPATVTRPCATCGREAQILAKHVGEPVTCGVCNEAQS